MNSIFKEFRGYYLAMGIDGLILVHDACGETVHTLIEFLGDHDLPDVLESAHHAVQAHNDGGCPLS
jgi:hypothetical protein